MAVTAQFAATPHISSAVAVTADASRTAPTTVVTVLTAAASGTRIDNIDFVAVGTTIASMLRLFIYNGTAYQLWLELPVLAVTPSSSVPVFSSGISSAVTIQSMPLVLPNGYSLRATMNDTQAGGGVSITARGGDF